ncbi:MAG: 2-dehydropantoate 2-reductase [Acidobacteriota bacterium]|nr:2-dehydropantoate 2-reductase [Acidobacteriota bacterium]
MRVAVIGAGGIGAVLAGVAAAAGHAVEIGVRTPIRTLSLQSPGGEWSEVAVTVRTTAAEVDAPADVVLLTVKATDTASAAPWLDAWCRDGTVLGVVQNGLDQRSRVDDLVPAGAVVAPVLAYMAAERLSAGRVRHLAGRRLVVPAECQAPLAEALPSLRVAGTDDMNTEAWRKLLANAVANPLTALTLRRVGVLAEPGMADLAEGMLREALAVGRASGARLEESLVEQILAGTAQYGPETGSSMLYDRLAGRNMEHRYITGEVVRRGRALGIPVPLNSVILTLLDATDGGVDGRRSQSLGEGVGGGVDRN